MDKPEAGPQNISDTISNLAQELEKYRLYREQDQASIERLRRQNQQLKLMLADYNKVLRKCIGQLEHVTKKGEIDKDMIEFDRV